MAMTHALVIFSLSPRLGVTGVDGHRSGKLDKPGKSVNVNVNTCSIHFGVNPCECACVFLCVLLRPR